MREDLEKLEGWKETMTCLYNVYSWLMYILGSWFLDFSLGLPQVDSHRASKRV